MANIYNFLKNACLKTSNLINNPIVFVYLISAILVAIPLQYIIGSIVTIIFVVVSILNSFNVKPVLSKILALPIMFFALMVLSLLWTTDLSLSAKALQNGASFLFIPLAFLLLPKINKNDFLRVFRMFSYAMVIFALYYFVIATFKYIKTGNKSVFFYHELVSIDLNAIYVSVFASFALFYFISKEYKHLIAKVAIMILVVLIFLLSSKSIITIDFLLVIFYYSFYAKISYGVKSTTIIAVSSFLLFSIFFVDDVKKRFLLEYETAFVDNTVNSSIGNINEKVYNVSLQQAWNNPYFEENHFFPGTALRVYQIRIFIEMLKEQSIFFKGFGLNAAQAKIKEKSQQHQLYAGYGDFNFHNQYIQTFAEIGIFGFLLLLCMLYVNLRNGIRNKDFLHIAFAVTMIILFLTESVLCRQRGILFFVTLYCIFNNRSYDSKIEKQN